MKTTVDIPALLLRPAELATAEQGISLQEFVVEAIRDKLNEEERIEGKPLDAGFWQTATIETGVGPYQSPD